MELVWEWSAYLPLLHTSVHLSNTDGNGITEDERNRYRAKPNPIA